MIAWLRYRDCLERHERAQGEKRTEEEIEERRSNGLAHGEKRKKEDESGERTQGSGFNGLVVSGNFTIKF